MAELSAADVDLYTHGRLSSEDPETVRILHRALRAVRRYCEWHVTPVKVNDVVTLDGPQRWSRVLLLPTGKLNVLHSVTEDGVALNLSDVTSSAGGPVRLRKKSHAHWSHLYSSIVVTMTHGFTEVEAEDFRGAVLDACDKYSQLSTSGLKVYTVDDVTREWFDRPAEEVFSTRLVEPFRIITP